MWVMTRLADRPRGFGCGRRWEASCCRPAPRPGSPDTWATSIRQSYRLCSSTPVRARDGHIFAPDVTIERRLLCGAGELHHDEAHFLREVRMSHERHSHIGIQFLT